MTARFEADFAICLKPEEAQNLKNLEKYYYWNGWRRRHWPANVVRPGVRLYAFDPRSNMRKLFALLEITKGSSFNYRKKSEFLRQVEKITGWAPNVNHPQWVQIPKVSAKEIPCTGVTLRWKVVKAASINLAGRFPRIGWLWLGDKEKLETIEDDFADLYSEGRRTLRKHTVIERNPKLRNASKAYWRIKMGHKLYCLICRFDFERKYKGYGKDFIEMHHLKPIAKTPSVKKATVRDLVPVCSNCYRILHWKRLEPLPIRQLRKAI